MMIVGALWEPGRPTFDTAKPHPARVLDYWSGGKDHYPVDRAFGERIFEAYPAIVGITRASVKFHSRAVRYLTGCAGIRQFLDIGCGLRTPDDSTHDIAERVAPAECRMVYVDTDPMVLAHARALPAYPGGAQFAVVDADVRDADKLLARAAKTLDLSVPVGVLLLGVLSHATGGDADEMSDITRTLIGGIAAGSYLVANEATVRCPEVTAAYQETYSDKWRPVTPGGVERLFYGLDVVEPGVVATPLWRPDPGETAEPLDMFCGVAHKPATGDGGDPISGPDLKRA